MLRLDSVHLSYGHVHAIKGVSLAVAAGEVDVRRGVGQFDRERLGQLARRVHDAEQYVGDCPASGLAQKGRSRQKPPRRLGTAFSRSFRVELAELKAAVPGLRLSVDCFHTEEELNALLRSDKELRLVYSDISRDPRVVSAGKNPFTASLFQPGYAGALETRRRLIELCEWDFNERYLYTE